MGLSAYLFKPILERLDRMEKKLIDQGAQMQKTLEEFLQVLKDLDEATTQVAADLEALKEQIANQGLTPEAEAEVFAKLEAAAARLKGLAADPETPVPSAE
jgi:predicted  nucleic acid-binding Zn-ribbon protein